VLKFGLQRMNRTTRTLRATSMLSMGCSRRKMG